MKSIYKFFGIILTINFLLLPITANAQEPVWTQDLNLNTSATSSIAQVEDGIVVLQYGQDSENSLLTKYDFNGQKIWEVPNTYGYNIETVSDGFIVWEESKITKFDKDKNIIWNQTIPFTTGYDCPPSWGGLADKLFEVSDGYIIGSSNYEVGCYKRDIFKLDLQGNIIKRVSQDDLLETENGNDLGQFVTMSQSLDKKSIIIATHHTETGINEFLICHFDNDLNYVKMYKNNIIDIDNINDTDEYLSGIIETKNNYIVYGRQTLVFNKSKNLTNIYNNIVLDLNLVNDYLYGYIIEPTNDNKENYEAFLVKYDQNMKEISKISLPLSFKADFGYWNSTSRVDLIKDGITYFVNNEKLNITVLNTPITIAYQEHSNEKTYFREFSTDYLDSKYQLINYAFELENKAQDSNSEKDNSGIIVNIIKNPQTNSVIIISIFIFIIIVTVSITCVAYKKKNKKSNK